MIKAYRYQLFPTKEQEVLLSKHVGCSRFVWNWALSEKIKAFQTDKTKLSRYDLQARLPVMKKQDEYSWLKEVNSLAIQSKLEDLDKAFVELESLQKKLNSKLEASDELKAIIETCKEKIDEAKELLDSEKE